MSGRGWLWFALGFALACSAGVASAGWSMGTGQCFETQDQAIQSAYRTMPRLMGDSREASAYVNLPNPCADSGGYYTCEFFDGVGTSLGSFRLYPTPCDVHEGDFSLDQFWLAPAVVGLFAVGVKLGMAR